MKYSTVTLALAFGSLVAAMPAKSASRDVDPNEGLDFTPYVNRPPPPGFDQGFHAEDTAISVPFHFENMLSSSNVKLYFTFQPPNQAGISFIGPNGNVYTPPAGASGNADLSQIEHSVNGGQGATYDFTLTQAFNSGRVYISDGSMTWPINSAGQVASPASENPNDPNYSLNWGFVEVNVGTDGSVFGNLSYVDFVGLILGADYSSQNAPGQLVPGLPADGVSQLCSLLAGETDWGSLCINGNSRVLSPNKAGAPNSLATYFDDYITQVFTRFTNEPLIFDFPDGTKPQGTVSNNVLTVNGFAWSKPTTPDIYSCNDGPFANPGADPTSAIIDPILCAAFNRGTLLLTEGNEQINGPAESTYYQNSVSNQYAKFVHQLELDGRGYALQYDEPHPAGAAEIAGTFSSGAGDPVTSLTVSIGGPASAS